MIFTCFKLLLVYFLSIAAVGGLLGLVTASIVLIIKHLKDYFENLRRFNYFIEKNNRRRNRYEIKNI